MKKILIFLFLTLAFGMTVYANDLPDNIIAVKSGENLSVSWKNPHKMSFVRIYSLENGEKNLLCEDFDTSPDALNEYRWTSSGETQNYLLNFRAANGCDSYYSISEFKDISKTKKLINGWTVCNSLPVGVDFALDRTDKKSGKSSLCISSASLNPKSAYIEQCVCDVIDKTTQYKLGFWIKSENCGVKVRSAYNKKSEGKVIDVLPKENGVWEYKEYIISGEDVGHLSISPYNSASVCIDDITLYRQKNGENYGVNLLENPSFEISDNIINNEISELEVQKSKKSKKSTYLRWTSPEIFDGEKFRIYQNGKVVAETDISKNEEKIFFRTEGDREYTVTTVDIKGNESKGVSITPEPLPYEGSIYRQYFDSPLSYNDFTKVNYTKDYIIQNNALTITAGKGIHLLPDSIVADEFILDMDIAAQMKSNANFSVLFGYNYDEETDTSSCSKIMFDVSGNVKSGQYSSTGKNAANLIAGTENTSLYDVFDENISHLRVVKNNGIVKVIIDGKTVHIAPNTTQSGLFGFETNIRITPTIDNIEIRTPDISADAVYDNNYKYGSTQFVSIPVANRVKELLTDGEKISYARLGGNTISVLESKEELSEFVFDFDYTMTEVLPSWTSAYCGPIFGYSDEKGWGYRIGLRHNGKIFVAKLFVDDTGKQVTEWASDGFEIGRCYKMRVTLKNGTLSLYCDGALIGRKSGLDETNGTFGFSSNGAGAEFKNILITPYYAHEAVKIQSQYTQNFYSLDAMPEAAVLINGNSKVLSAYNGLICESDDEAVYILENVEDDGTSVYEAEISFDADDGRSSEFSMNMHSTDGLGYYRIGLSESGKVTLVRYDDDFTVSDTYVGTEDTGVRADVSLSEKSILRAIALNNVLYVFVDDKLCISEEIHNDKGGFGFGVKDGSVKLEALSVRSVTNADIAMLDGYSAVIENLSVNENMVSFDVSAGTKLDNVSIITAVYEDEMLKEVKILEPVSMSSGTAIGYSTEMLNTVGNNKVKVMIFNTMKEMMPLAAVCGN